MMKSAPLETLAKGKYLHLVKRGTWEWVQRPSNHDAVCIIATTSDDHLILVEQYRYPLSCNTIELPAGLVGDEVGKDGEPVLTAAKRELEEETGHISESWQNLGRFASSAGMSSEAPMIVTAADCRKVSDGGGVDGEDITVRLVPLSTAEKWLKQRQTEGLIIDTRVLFGLAMARNAIAL
ncbi:MAG: NUDIX hydrolase [Sphingomonadales bacterium]